MKISFRRDPRNAKEMPQFFTRRDTLTDRSTYTKPVESSIQKEATYRPSESLKTPLEREDDVIETPIISDSNSPQQKSTETNSKLIFENSIFAETFKVFKSFEESDILELEEKLGVLLEQLSMKNKQIKTLLSILKDK
jgi:hypothetical protein